MSDNLKDDVFASLATPGPRRALFDTLPGAYVLHVPTGVCGTVREVWASGESGWLRGPEDNLREKEVDRPMLRKVTAEDVPGAADSADRRFLLCTHPVVVFDSGHKLLCRAGEESSFQALTVDERVFFAVAVREVRRKIGELADTNEALRLAEKRASLLLAVAIREAMKP